MENKKAVMKAYEEILKRELVPAMGCTEPIALAYCAAKARALLGVLPERVVVFASGNIIKNVKSVIVPNTGGARGIEAAAAIGITAGREDLELEVLSMVTEAEKVFFKKYLEETPITIKQSESKATLDIFVNVYKGDESAAVRISGKHTNIVYMRKNDEVLLDQTDVSDSDGEVQTLSAAGVSDKAGSSDAPDKAAGSDDSDKAADTLYGYLNIRDIYDYADSADISPVEAVLDRQIEYNTKISDEGLRGDYGANIGKVILKTCGSDVRSRAKARAAAGSDARMNGCELPVVINSGSGNQGLTVSLPVIEYAKEIGAEKERLYRALVLANLTAIHQKKGIGSLSAYCGAVSAGAAAAAGIAYLKGGDFETVAHTLVNTLAITSGMICDGAKASCAAKIAMSVEAGILGYEMYLNGQQFYAGEGLVSKGVEKTIQNICTLGRDGMKETDREIIHMMTCVD